MSAVTDDVLLANDSFYQAFAGRDVDRMEEVWARRAPVACVHPGWQPLMGRDAVMASWRGILRGPGAPDITCTEAICHVVGDGAFVVCIERLDGGTLVATNVFIREDGAWRIIHHQAGAIADDLDEQRPDPERLH